MSNNNYQRKPSPTSSAKLKITTKPWNDTDLSYKNRATISPYVEEVNPGFNVFLNHPDEVGKKYTTRSGSVIELSKLPLSARMDRIQFISITNSLIRLADNPQYEGLGLDLYNIWKDDKGEPIKVDGKITPCHTATVETGRDADGVIYLAIREEKHPNRDKRPGVIVRFENTNRWVKYKDNKTKSDLSKAEESKDIAKAYAMNWAETVIREIDDNFEAWFEKQQARQQQARQQQSTQQGTQQPGNWGNY